MTLDTHAHYQASMGYHGAGAMGDALGLGNCKIGPEEDPAHLLCSRFTCKTALCRSGAEGIRTPDLRRAKADRHILACPSTSGDYPYLRVICGTADNGLSAAY